MAGKPSSKPTTATGSRPTGSATQQSKLEVGLTDASSVRAYLQARINPRVVSSLDARLRLAWPVNSPLGAQDADQFSLCFELAQGQLVWLDEKEPTQATFWFRDAQDVGHLLSGSDSAYADFMERFMAAQLSSDGYLPWAFTLLSLFRGGSSLATPD